MNEDFKELQNIYESAVNEGILNRIGANIAGATGAVGGALKGAYYGATGNAQGAADAATKARNAKFESYKKAADAKLEKIYNEITTDLTKLNLVDQTVMKPVIDQFKQNLANSFSQFLQVITTKIAPTPATTSTTKPIPVPAASNQTAQQNTTPPAVQQNTTPPVVQQTA